MNKSYRSIWNASKQVYVAAAETVNARGKPCSSTKVAAAMAGLLGGLFALGAQAQTAPPPNALPTGGQVTAGQANIGQNGAHMVIQQTTERAAVNWQSFNVGKDAHVQFQQPGASSVTLNRVMTSDPSQIFGRITANGQVILTNPQGVYFGRDSRVDVGGLVATTNSIGDADFMAGKSRFERNGSTGSVVNEGELKAALGGFIALLAPEVRNQGAIIAQMGTVALAAGEAVDLKFDSNSRLTSIRVEPSQIKALVENRHAVQAPGGLIILSAQSMDRLVGGVVRNSGRIEANGLQQQGGRIILSASHKVENTGSIAANATAGGDGGPAGRIEITAPEVVNAGSISATGVETHGAGSVQIQATQVTQTDTGRIELSAAKQGGILSIQAQGSVQLQGQIDVSATQDPSVGTSTQGGQIEVLAGDDITVSHATLDASGGQGGQINLRAAAEPQPENPMPLPQEPGPGRVAIIGQSTLSTRGRRGQGGSAMLLGDHIELQDHIAIDASGATGGGKVLVGGDWQGSNGVYQATTVYMGQGVTIDASATEQGHGGTVVLWSDIHKPDSVTIAHGSVISKGGSMGGDGGQVETSGHTIDIDGFRVNTLPASEALGKAGVWLIDPYNYTIGSTQAQTIGDELGNTSVIVTTASQIGKYGSSANSGDSGDIRVEANILKTGSAETTLTLRAARDIWFASSGVKSEGGKLNVVLIADDDSSNGGAIYFDGGSAITVNTKGGHVWMGGNAGSPMANANASWNGLTVGAASAGSSDGTSIFEGVKLRNVSLNTAGGDLYIAGRNNRYINGQDRYGVWIQSGTSISTGAGSIEIKGHLVSRAGILLNYPVLYGVSVVGGSTLETTTGSITITGGEDANGISYSWGGFGVHVSNSTIKSTGTTGGVISITGTTGADNASGYQRDGIMLIADAANQKTIISSNAGNITLTGATNVTNNAVSAGIRLKTLPQENPDSNNPVVAVTSQTGNVTLTGDNPNNSHTDSRGVYFSGGGYGKIFVGGDGTNPYTGSTVINARSIGDAHVATGNVHMLGMGSLTIQPTASSFFTGTSTLNALSIGSIYNLGTEHSSLTLGKTGNAANINLNTAITVAGAITVRGGVVSVNDNLTSSADGDIFLKGISNSGSGLFSITAATGKTIAKTAGLGTLTLQAQGRILTYSNISATGTGKLNVVLWSDYDNSNNDGGISAPSGSISTKGGDVWMGGSNSNGGNYFWKGLSVGDGPSVGTANSNYNGMDLFIPIVTNGGDVLVWAGPGYGGGVNGIATNGAGSINAGSGNVTLISSTTNGAFPITTTGTLTLTPNANTYGSGQLLNVNGTLTNGNLSINTSFYNGMTINGLANLSGLTIGQYSGMLNSSSQPVVFNNTSPVEVRTALTVAGPIAIYGGSNIGAYANLTTSDAGAAGDVLLKASGSITQASNVSVTTSGAKATFWADSDGNGTGYVQLMGGASVTTNGGAIVMGGGTDIATGYAKGEATRDTQTEPTYTLYIAGVHFRSGVRLSSGGGDITLRGQNVGGSSSAMAFGVFGNGSVIDSGIGKIAITGLATGSASLNAQAISGYSGWTLRSANTTAQAITLLGDATGVSGASTSIGVNFSGSIEASGEGGGITITGKSGTATGFDLGTGIAGNVLAISGPIVIVGENNEVLQAGLNFDPGAALGAKAATNITSSSSDITLKAHQFSFNAATPITTSGKVYVLPLDGATSFGSGQTFGSNFALSTDVSGLTIGKNTNSADIIVASAISIAGPITIYGGAVALNANLATSDTSTGDVLIKTTGLIGSGNVSLASGRGLTVDQSGNSIYFGAVSGANATLTKAGAGRLSLLASSTYTGGTTVSAGTLGVYHDSAMGTGAVTFAEGTGLLLGRSVTQVANDISLAGAATISLDTGLEYLIVGGGGGGGSRHGGGGGGGGLFQGSVTSYDAQTASVVVGAGGTGGVGSGGAIGTIGLASTLTLGASVLTAEGGSGGRGGSTGGSSGIPQGNAGGNGYFGGGDAYFGGGGGGAGAAGSSKTGGAGLQSWVTGLLYGGGGGGGSVPGQGSAGLGGSGGGANGRSGNGIAGTSGLGGGGGGGGITGVGGSGLPGGAGGSGTVVIRYLGGAAGTGGTITAGTGSASGYTVHTITSIGASTVTFTAVAPVLSGAISGAGALALNAAGGEFRLAGNNIHSGGTTISGGTVKVGNGSTSGTLGTGAVVNNASLILNRSDAFTVGNNISGTGSLTKLQTNVATLTGSNSYNGTTISDGTLQIGDGGTAGTLGSGAVTNNATLAFNRSDDVTVATAIGGTGVVTKEGANTLTLTANSNYTGATNIANGTLVLRNDAPTKATSGFSGPGALRIEPAASFTSGFSTTGWNFNTSLGGLTLGLASNSSMITVGSAISIAGPIRIHGGDINLNQALTASSGGLTPTLYDINLHASGAVTQGASGAITAGGLGLHGSGNFTLTHGSNSVTTLAGGSGTVRLGSLSFTNAGALTIGSVNPTGIHATGDVLIETLTGDLVVSESINTLSTSSTAVRLVADKDKNYSAGDSGAAFFDGSGGSVTITSGVTDGVTTWPTITTGAGGRATLYTGSIAGSTGVVTSSAVADDGLVKFGAGRFRYGSDESTTNFGSALGAGTQVVYRERPVLDVTAGSQAMTYGDSPALTVDAGGSLPNGDAMTDAVPTTPGVLVWADSNATSAAVRNGSGHYDAGSYTLTTEALSEATSLGYALNPVSGTLTVNRRSVIVTARDDAKFYSQTDQPGYAGVTYTGLAAGDTSTGNAISLGRANSGIDPDNADAPVTGEAAGVYALTPGGSANSANYNISYAAGTFTILPVNRLRVTVGTSEAVYGTATPTYTATNASYISSPNSVTVDDTSTLTVGDEVAIKGGGQVLTQATILAIDHDTGIVTIGQTTAAFTGADTLDKSGQEVGVTATGQASEISLTVVKDTGSAVEAVQFKDAANKAIALNIGNGGTLNSNNLLNVGTYTLNAANVTADAGIAVSGGVKLVGNLVITPKALSLTASKTYDGKVDLGSGSGGTTLSGNATHAGAVALAGVVAGEALNYSGAAASDRNAGNTHRVSAITLEDGDKGLVSNYVLPNLTVRSADNTADIDRRMLTVSASKTYDGTTNVTSSTVLGNLVTGESLTISGATASSAHVADNATNYITNLTLANGSGLLGNYELPSLTAVTADVNTVTITPRPLQLSLVNTGVSKVYDGDHSAKVGDGVQANADFIPEFVVSNAISGDTFALADFSYNAAYNSANVTQANTLNVTDLSLTGLTSAAYGSASSDYTLANNATSVSASITPRPVAVSGSGVSKIYDGLMSMNNVSIGFVNVSGQQESGLVAGQSLSVSGGTGTFSSADAGNGKGYSLAGFSLTASGGADAENYSLPGGGNAVLSGSDGMIFKRPLNIVFTGDTKVYDGNVNATVTATFADNAYAPVAGDDLLINRNAIFDDKNVGVGASRVTVSNVTLSGTAAGNYHIDDDASDPLQSALVRTEAGFNAVAAGQIERRDSVTWVGGVSADWFDPANWALTSDLSVTGVVPDLSNVARVIVPAGSAVNFNGVASGLANASQPVSLEEIQAGGASLNVSIGTLAVGSSGVALDGFTQTGGAVSSTGNFTVTSVFSQSGGMLSTTDNAAHISINQANGSLSWSSISAGGNLLVTSGEDIAFGGTIVGGDLLSTSGTGGVIGGVTQAANTSLTVTGSSTFLASTLMDQDALLNGDNVFGGAVSFTGVSDGNWRNVTVNDTSPDGMILGNITTTGTLDATAAGDLTFDGAVNVASLDLASTNGSISQGANSTLAVTDGPTNLNANGSITLGGANDFNGPVNVLGGTNVTLNDTNGLTLGNVTATGSLDATAGGDLTLDGPVNVVSLDLASTNGSISQGANSTLAVTDGPTNLNANGSITLGGANDFNGPVNVLGGTNVTLNDTNGLTLGNVTATGSLDATAGGDLTLDGPVNVASLDLASSDGSISQGANSTLSVTDGPTKLNANGSITLAQANDFNGPVNVLGGTNVTLNDTNGLTLGDVTASGALDVTVKDDVVLAGDIQAGSLAITSEDGAISQTASSKLTVDGQVDLMASGDINLNFEGGNDFRGLVNANGDNVKLRDSNALSLGIVNAGGNLLLASMGPLNLGITNVGGDFLADSGNGGITQSGPLRVGGFATFEAGTGAVMLTDAGNSLPNGTAIKASSYTVAGDARKTVGEAQEQVQGTLPVSSLPGTGLSNAASPQALVLSSSADSASSSSRSSSGGQVAAVGGDSTGVTVDLRNTTAPETDVMAAVSLPKGYATVGTGFSFDLPESIRAMAREGTAAQASLPDGSPLPSWLRFDAQSLRFESAAVPDGAFPLQLVLSIGGGRVLVVISERGE